MKTQQAMQKFKNLKIETVFFSNDKVVGMTSTAFLSAKIDFVTTEPFALDTKEALALFKAVKAPRVVLDSTNATFTEGRMKRMIPLVFDDQPVPSYYPEGDPLYIHDASIFHTLVKGTSKDPGLPQLNHVWHQWGHWNATNGHVLFRATSPIDESVFIDIHRELVSLFPKRGPVRVTPGAGRHLWEVGDWSILTFPMEKNPPPADKVVPKKCQHTYQIKGIYQAVKQAITMTKDCVIMDAAQDKLIVDDHEIYGEWGIMVSGDEGRWGFNPRYLLDSVEGTDSVTFKASGETDATMIEHGPYSHVVMPCRI